jgi:PleD family two-component response regulator
VDVIIAIDSESEYLDNTESLLSSAKYNFIKATEYKKGMDYAKTATPDLVMIGINRIDKELIDAVQFFKKNVNTKNIPILGIFKEQKRTDIETGFKLGISAYLVQPLDKHRLLDKVKELMEISKENQK